MPETVTTYTDAELGLDTGWDHNSDGAPLDPNIRQAIRQSRITAKELEQERSARQQAERQLGFRDAGIPNDAKGQFFAKSYDGPTDAESVRTAYEALFGAPAGSGEQSSEAGADTSAEQRIAAAGSGGTPSGAGTVKLEDALRAAKGDPAKLREIIAAAPPEAGIKLPDIY